MGFAFPWSFLLALPLGVAAWRMLRFIGFRSNFPQLLSAFLGALRLHTCNDLGDGGETLFGSGLRRCRGFGGTVRTALDKGLAVDGFEIERRLAVDLAA